MDFQDFDNAQPLSTRKFNALAKLLKQQPLLVGQLLERRSIRQGFFAASFLEQLLV